MNNLKLFRKPTFLVAIVALIAILTLSVVAISASEEAGGNVEGFSVGMKGYVTLKFHYDNVTSGGTTHYHVEVANKAVDIPVASIKNNTISVALSPTEMSETVTVTAYNGTSVGKSASYSVKEYAQAVLANKSHASYHDAMRALLNWGAHTETAFVVPGTTADGLFAKNDPISSVTPERIAANSKYQKPTETASSGNAFDKNNSKINLLLGEGTISLRFYIKANSNLGNVDATLQGSKWEDTTPIPVAAKYENGYYVVTVSGISTTLFDNMYTLKLTSGSNSITTQTSVLRYLVKNLENSDISEKEQDAVRALYQFFQLTTNTTGVDSCAHTKNDSEWHFANIDDTHWGYKCSLCFKELDVVYKNETGFTMLPDQIATTATQGDIVSRTVMYENGIPYLRMNATEWHSLYFIGSSTGNASIPSDHDVDMGRYLILKVRIPTSNPSEQTMMRFYVKSGENAETETRVAIGKSDEWQTVLLDLDDRAGAAYDAVDGKYTATVLRLLPLCPGQWGAQDGVTANDCFDIAYIASVNESSEIWEYIDVNEKYIDSISNTKSVATKKINEYTTADINNAPIAAEGDTVSNIKSLQSDYVHYKGTSNWPQLDVGFAISEADKDTSVGRTVDALNISDNKYIAMMVKGSNSPVIYLNGAGSASKSTFGLEGVTGNWGLVVLDLKGILGTDFVANSSGDYILETFCFRFINPRMFSPSTSFDIKYIKFASSLDEIYALTGEKTATVISKGGSSYLYHNENNSQVTNTSVVTATTTLTTASDYNSQGIADALHGTSESSINNIRTHANGYVHYFGNDSWPACDILFATCQADADTYVGKYATDPLNIGSNKYIAMMVKGNTSPLIYLNGKGAASVTTFALANFTSNEWQLVVLDLESILGDDFTADAYGRNILETFYLRFITPRALQSGHFFDIQYIKFASSLEEISKLTGESALTLVQKGGSTAVENTNTSVVTSTVYHASFTDEEFLKADHTVDESAAVSKTAAEMLAILSDKTAIKSGAIYRVTEPLYLASDTSYYGEFASIIAEGGVIIDQASDIVIKDLIIKGNITVNASQNITLHRVAVQSDSTAITINPVSKNISLNNCKITATDTAINASANELAIYKSNIKADKGIILAGYTINVQSCTVEAGSVGISSCGSFCTIKDNEITASENGIGVEITSRDGMYPSNGLIALNNIKGANTSVKVVGGYNCVVLLNNGINVQADWNTNIYVNENKLRGSISLSNNNYMLCNDNVFPRDGQNHPVTVTSCTNINGNNVHDVDARADAGVNSELLPHTNKDLFIGATRLTEVKDVSLTRSYSYTAYIQQMAKQSSVVIVPPGAYSTTSAAKFNQAGVTLYAYGVYQEMDSVPEGQTDPISSDPNATIPSKMGHLVEISAPNVSIHGLTMGYDFQSSGQAYIVDKYLRGDNAKFIKIVTAAGYADGFGKSNSRLYDSTALAIHGDELAPWIRNAVEKGYDLKTPDDTASTIESDGTMWIRIYDMEIYNLLQKGDVLGTRLANGNTDTVYITSSSSLLEDCVIYGHSAALSITAEGRGAKDMQLNRVHNTVHSAPVIDKATYDKYKALESKYGLTSDGDNPIADGAQGLEVYIDASGRYRGALPRFGSVDGTHLRNCAGGMSATSSIFEQMVDDASNQRGDTARIAAYHDNGDGTSTIYWKGSTAENYHTFAQASGHEQTYPRYTSAFKKGDVMFAYGYGGQTLIEAAVLEDQVPAGALPGDTHAYHYDTNNDHWCDHTGCLNPSLHYDFNSDGLCDSCSGTTGNKTMTTPATYDHVTSTLTWYMPAYNATKGNYLMEYRSAVWAVKVKTSDVNTAALSGYDLADNNYTMDEKIFCDNRSMSSPGFTYDNVLMQNYNSRGILAKTLNVTIKHCSFRDVGMTGVLLSVETAWGESTVPKNVTVANCVFDGVGRTRGSETSPTHAAISIQGYGDFNDISNLDTLPCENITITGNKFLNTFNYYAITVSGAKNVDITNNYITGRSDNHASSKAILIKGCNDVEVSGNTYSFGGKTLSEIIDAQNYKNLHGSDITSAGLPQN